MSERSLKLSGERFTAVYHLEGDRAEVSDRAWDICLEQTVEYPEDLISRPDIREQVFGRVESVTELAENRYEVVIGFAVETAGEELTQLLNVLFGNISLKPGIRLVDFVLPDTMAAGFTGPRFGRQGLRELTGVPKGPILCSAIKPMGLSAAELAELAYGFARGGIHIIKDDHGIADQRFCRFDERVKRCAEAVRRANRESGRRCLYFPNVTAPADRIGARVRSAKQAGAHGVLIAPGLTGFDAMRRVADDDDVALPIMSHPAMLGSFTVSPTAGISHGALYGLINRLAGADAAVFPSFDGRFTFSESECREIVGKTESKMGDMKPIFPAPGGGMTLDRVPALVAFYGPDAVLLIGGDLHRHGTDLSQTCQKFRSLVNGHRD